MRPIEFAGLRGETLPLPLTFLRGHFFLHREPAPHETHPLSQRAEPRSCEGIGGGIIQRMRRVDDLLRERNPPLLQFGGGRFVQPFEEGFVS